MKTINYFILAISAFILCLCETTTKAPNKTELFFSPIFYISLIVFVISFIVFLIFEKIDPMCKEKSPDKAATKIGRKENNFNQTISQKVNKCQGGNENV